MEKDIITSIQIRFRNCHGTVQGGMATVTVPRSYVSKPGRDHAPLPALLQSR